MKSAGEYAAMVEQALPQQLASLGNMPEKLLEAMAYSLEAGGKRLRPVLLLAVCDAMGKDLASVMPYACALEMIHTYSLIHDDLPAMDNDNLRRGKPTNHVVFGEGMAILAGDGLLHGAVELMLRTACKEHSLQGLHAAETIARRAGVTGMVAGQVMDVTQEGGQVTEEKVTYIHAHKTADMLIAPVEAGLILAGAKPEEVSAGIAYGYHLGMAFQMVDDLLDVIGDEQVMGKQTGMDAQQGKMTWVALKGIQGTKEDAAAHIRLACDAASQFDHGELFFRELAKNTLNRVQ